MLYKKKPVVIEAFQWDGTIQDMTAIRDKFRDIEIVCIDEARFSVVTLEGTYLVTPGDFIIKGVKGEYYPCDPDIFKLTYEEVNEGDTTYNEKT